MLLVELLLQVSEDELYHVEVGILWDCEQDFDLILDEETLHDRSLMDCCVVHQDSYLLSMELILELKDWLSEEILDDRWFHRTFHESERDNSRRADYHEEVNWLEVSNLP